MDYTNETSIRIIDISMKHFLKFGYKDTFLGKIAEEANVGRKTVYRHFENKNNLVITIMSRLYVDFSNKLKLIRFECDTNAYEKIKRLFDFYFEYMANNTEFLYFSNMIDTNIFQDHSKEDIYSDYLASTNSADILLHSLLDEGQLDKSIDKIDNTYLAAVTINNVLISHATSMFRSNQVSTDFDHSLEILRQMIMKYIKS